MSELYGPLERVESFKHFDFIVETHVGFRASELGSV